MNKPRNMYRITTDTEHLIRMPFEKRKQHYEAILYDK